MKTKLLESLRAIESYNLPIGLRWWKFTYPYMNEGQTIFPVYGLSGGLQSRFVAYIVPESFRSDGRDLGTKGVIDLGIGKGFALEIFPHDSFDCVKGKIDDAVKVINGN